MTFNKNIAKDIIDVNLFEREFEKHFTNVLTGSWAIYWKGIRVRPEACVGDTFPSYDSALAAIGSCMPIFYNQVERLVFEHMTGKRVDTPVIGLSRAYIEHFRCDLWYDIEFDGDNVSDMTYFHTAGMSEEDIQIRDEFFSAELQFKSFCRTAMMTIMVPQWLSSGTLEIRRIF